MFTFGSDVLVTGPAGAPVVGVALGLRGVVRAWLSRAGMLVTERWLPWLGGSRAGYGGAGPARASSRRGLRAGGGSWPAAWRASPCWRVCQAVRVRWLRTTMRQVSDSMSGV